MKRIRVTITEEYVLPDDWEVFTHPDDGLLCLRGDNNHFTPSIDWCERQPVSGPEGAGPLPQFEWVSADDARGNWFIDHTEETEVEIRELE